MWKPLNRSVVTRTCSGVATLTALALGTFMAVEVAAQQRVAFQVRGDSFRGDTDFHPAMTERQLRRYSEVLTLDDTQALVAEQMLADYRAQFEDAASDVRREMADLQEEAMATGDFSIFSEKYGPIAREWSDDRERMEQELIDSLRSLLRDDQLPHWDTFERERRRAKLLPNGRLGGEDVDVINLLGDLDLPQETRDELAPLVEQYALELDAALQSRDRALEPLREDWRASLADGDRAGEIWEEGTDKRLTVRNLNRRFVDMFAAELGEPYGADLHDAWLRAAYPMAFEETKADLMFEAVDQLQSLDGTQVDQLTAVRASFASRIAPLRAKIIEQIMEDELEPPQFLQAMTNASNGEGGAFVISASLGGDEDDPMSELLKDRYYLSKETIERIEDALTEVQRDALPQIDMPQNFRLPGGRFRFDL